MSTLKLARGLTLDADEAGGWTFGILAKKGAGKTYTGRVMAEEMFAARIPIVALDPTGAWWGLRAAANGQDPGIPVVIFGGDHGDAPLEPTAGAVMADMVADESLSMVLDMSAFGTRSAERRFALDFLERLYRRNRELVHLFVDEADVFAPQRPQKGDEPLLGAMQNIIRRGRIKGIGATLITQRPAVLSKDVLTQIDVLVALRLTSPQDRDAIREWVKGHGADEKQRDVFDSLAGLQNGESWWWAPELDLFKRTQVREARTFDSSPTPRRGASKRAPKTFADVDLAAVSERIASTIERQKADDPRELRRQIAALRKQVTAAEKQQKPAPPPEPVVEYVDRPVLDDGQVGALGEMVEGLGEHAGRIIAAANEIATALRKVNAPAPRVADPPRREAPARPAPRAPVTREPVVVADGDFRPTSAQQRVLDALAMLEAIGIASADKTQLALFAATKPTSGGYKNNLGALRNQAGYIEYPTPRRVTLTDAGRAVADAAAAPQDTEELHALVRGLVPATQMALVDALIDVYPGTLTREELAERVAVPVTSGGFKNNLGRLRSLGLIDYPKQGYVHALPVLFLEDAA